MLLHPPEAILRAALLLINIGRLPLGFDRVVFFPEFDKEVRDLARWWQKALQVECVVAGWTEAPRRDDGRAELQTVFRTDGERNGGDESQKLIFLWRENRGGSEVKADSTCCIIYVLISL